MSLDSTLFRFRSGRISTFPDLVAGSTSCCQPKLNHVDSAEGGHVGDDRQGSPDEAGGAGTSSGAGLGCAERVSGWHDLHRDVSMP